MLFAWNAKGEGGKSASYLPYLSIHNDEKYRAGHQVAKVGVIFVGGIENLVVTEIFQLKRKTHVTLLLLC